MKKDITILTTWDGEVIELEVNFMAWLEAKGKAKMNGDDGILIQNNSRFLKFSNLKDEKGKTRYLELEAPKKEKERELSEEERIRRDEIIREALAKTFEGRKKRFIEERKELLENLKKREVAFGLDPTIDRLEEYNILKLEKQKSGL